MPAEKRPPDPEGTRSDDSAAVGWFAEMLLAIDRRDFRRATESQRELAKIGWDVTPRTPRRPRHGQGGGR